MHVLYLTTQYPWPPSTGGSVRSISQLHIMTSLDEVASVTVLSVTEEPIDAADVRALEAAIPKLRVVPPVFHPIHLFDFKRYVPRVVALRVFRGVPYFSGKWESGTLRAALRGLLAERHHDVVWIDHLGMARYRPDIEAVSPGSRVVLDQHNVESDFLMQYAQEKRGLRKRIVDAEYRASAAFERDAMRGVDAVVAISTEDARRFHALTGVDAHVVPMVLPFERIHRTRPPAPHFCYVGNLRWRPNVAGLDWLCREVWPIVRARVPDATFEIAGIGLRTDEHGAPDIPAAWQVPGVVVVGFVEDLEPMYARSIGMLAPVFGGSGVRMKMLEGFRAGMPVVTTPDGAFGLPITDGKEALVAAGPAAFAERMVALVDDEATRLRVRDGGYTYLEQHHSERAARRIMRTVLDCTEDVDLPETT